MKDKATFEISGNFECKKDAPFDTRWRVDAYADLINEETWLNKDGNIYAYTGMCTTCKDKPGKIYQLTDVAHLTNYAYWKEIGEQKLIEIVNNLTSGDTNKALSAAMGKKLNDEKIDKSAITTDIINSEDKVASASSVFNVNTSKLDKSAIVNNVNSTDVTKVLSAAQGKVLNDRINSLGSVYKYKGNKDTIEDVLAITDAKIGDVWNVIQEFIAGGKKYPAGTNVACIKNTSTSEHSEANWDPLGGTVDLSGYATKIEMNSGLNGKVAKSDIVNDLTTGGANKVLSAEQGKSLNDELHTLDNTVQDVAALIPTKVSQLTNDSNYLTFARVLTKDNTDVYNPTTDYHPATKKYVDDKVAAGSGGNSNFVDFDFSKVNALTSQSTAQEVKDAFVGYEKLKTDSIIRLVNVNETGDFFDSGKGHVEAFYTNVDGAGFSFSYIDKSENQFVKIVANGENGNIELWRINIVQDIPTNLVKYKIINVNDGSLLTINKQLFGIEAEQHISKIFGSSNIITEIAKDICENNTKYYIHSYNDKYNTIETSDVYAYWNKQEEYNLQFNISYYTNNGPVSKRIGMKIDTSDATVDELFIEDILVSDNLQRVVKRTKSEYESTSPKDASTLYAVTE
jgi:hypothetical protein